MAAADDGIVRYDAGAFDRARPTYLDAVACSKIVALLSGFSCFQQPEEALPSQGPAPYGVSLRGSGSRRVAHGTRGPPSQAPGAKGAARAARDRGDRAQQSERRPRIEAAGVCPGMRIVVAALNKLTAKNYGTLHQQIVRGVKEQLVKADSVCDALLTKCYTEDCYASLYVRLLQDVAQACERSIVEECVSSFVSAFLSAPLVPPSPVAKAEHKQAASSAAVSATTYDVFCDAVKMRKHTVGRHRAVLALLSSGLVPCSIHTPPAHTALLSGLAREQLSRDPPSLDEVDVTLDFISDAVKTKLPGGPTDCGAAEWRALFEEAEIVEACDARLPPKSRFRIQDILDITKQPGAVKAPLRALKQVTAERSHARAADTSAWSSDGGARRKAVVVPAATNGKSSPSAELVAEAKAAPRWWHKLRADIGGKPPI